MNDDHLDAVAYFVQSANLATQMPKVHSVITGISADYMILDDPHQQHFCKFEEQALPDD